MTDLIDRQAAIDAIGGAHFKNYGNAIMVIQALPSAYPKNGKWIKADSQQYFRKHYPCFTCSECGYRKDSQKKWNYCPNCGADMRGEE